jgi:hypothetical protein
MASTQVIRVTMFKFLKKEDHAAMIEIMREMMRTAVKVYEFLLYLAFIRAFRVLCLAGFRLVSILTFYLIAQDGKPYILSIESGPTSDDSNPNCNFVGKTIFKNLEDMKYYQNECVAHKKLKAKVASELAVQGPPTTVYYTPILSMSL